MVLKNAHLQAIVGEHQFGAVFMVALQTSRARGTNFLICARAAPKGPGARVPEAWRMEPGALGGQAPSGWMQGALGGLPGVDRGGPLRLHQKLSG